MNGFDRRNQARVTMTATGTIYERDVQVGCSTLDVCLRGMRLATLERREPGDLLRVVWKMGERDLEVEAVVIHATLHDCGTWVLGTRFVQMSDDAPRTIVAHIRHQTMGARLRATRGPTDSPELALPLRGTAHLRTAHPALDRGADARSHRRSGF